MAVVEFAQVKKQFGAVTALNEVSFSIPEGGIFGFLGANGAGKTTSLRMILDILQPDSGKIAVFGEKPSREMAARIGYLPEERGLYVRMSVEDNLKFFARLRGLDRKAAARAAEDAMQSLGIADLARLAVKALSKGNAQKVQLAATAIAEPKLLLLDEPFSGLDPLAQQGLEELLRRAAAKGATVIFSTHVMAQAERLSQSLLLLARGKLLFQGTLAEILAATAQKTLHDSFLHLVGEAAQ